MDRIFPIAVGSEGPDAAILSEAGCARLFGTMPVGMAIIDHERRIVDVNPALCRLLGYSAEEMTGHTFAEFTHPDDVASSLALSSSLRAGAIPSYQLQKRYLHRDGRVVWSNVHVAALRPSTGHGWYSFCIIEDITGMKAEKAILHSRIAEQRRALIRETHHRIKNTLQGIAGLLEQHAHDEPAAAPALRLAIERIHSVALVHGMCAAPGSETPNCCDVTSAIAVALQEQYGREIVISVAGATRPVLIHSDELVPYALVLTELIANAIKHAPDASRPVIVEVLRDVHAVTVQVMGIGARLPAGFDFARGMGLGTGLSLAKSLLPPRGLELAIFQLDDRVVSRMRLEAPIVAPSRGDEAEGAK